LVDAKVEKVRDGGRGVGKAGGYEVAPR
jgi:hypothetical protein